MCPAFYLTRHGIDMAGRRCKIFYNRNTVDRETTGIEVWRETWSSCNGARFTSLTMPPLNTPAGWSSTVQHEEIIHWPSTLDIWVPFTRESIQYYSSASHGIWEARVRYWETYWGGTQCSISSSSSSSTDSLRISGSLVHLNIEQRGKMNLFAFMHY